MAESTVFFDPFEDTEIVVLSRSLKGCIMKDAMHRGEPVVAPHQNDRQRKRSRKFCAVCDCRIWFDVIHMHEPVGVPEPRLSWTLCRDCHGALVTEMRRSPVRSPLRLRIAMGIVAAERWPNAYPSEARQMRRDYRWVIFIAAGTFIAMLLHLVLIVILAGIK